MNAKVTINWEDGTITEFSGDLYRLYVNELVGNSCQHLEIACQDIVGFQNVMGTIPKEMEVNMMEIPANNEENGVDG